MHVFMIDHVTKRLQSQITEKYDQKTRKIKKTFYITQVAILCIDLLKNSWKDFCLYSWSSPKHVGWYQRRSRMQESSLM